MSIDDWRYSDQKMKVREQALTVLLSRYGGEMEEGQPKYSSQSIYECVQDWVSQGNMNTAGIVKYYNPRSVHVALRDPILNTLVD